MAYGIQILGPDSTIAIQIDSKLPRIITGGSFSMPAGQYPNGYAIAIPATADIVNSTLNLMIQPSYLDDIAYGWHFSFSKYLDTSTSQWYLIINAMTATAINHVAHSVIYNIVEWR